MKQILLKFFIILLIAMVNFYNSQMVAVRGIVKDSSGTNGIAISVNDTIRKFRDKAFKDSIFKEKYWKNYDELIHNQNLFTYPDSIGNYTITAKRTDTLYFYKRKYTTQKYKVADIINNNIKVILAPSPCIPFKKCDQKIPSKLYAFIGKKINVTFVDQSKYCGISLDSEYKAEYKIEQEFKEHNLDSEIIFSAYDHNNMYEYDFRNYDTVLLFVGEYCGDLIKDFFFPIYKTADGRWATPIKMRDEHYYKNYKPTKITFEKSLYFDVSNLPIEHIEYRFPKEYYKIENGKAIPIMGRYAEDLVKLWEELNSKSKE